MAAYGDVSLPVPVDQLFTYALPETMRHRVRAGCRVLVPFGSRKLAGVVLRVHDDPPAAPVRQALRLLDEEPALDEALLKLGCWIASYYCAPLGETLRAMTPLSGELRQGRVYSLTPAGRGLAHPADARRAAAVIGELSGEKDRKRRPGLEIARKTGFYRRRGYRGPAGSAARRRRPAARRI